MIIDMGLFPNTRNCTRVRLQPWGRSGSNWQRRYNICRMPGRICQSFRSGNKNTRKDDHRARGSISTKKTIVELTFKCHYFKGIDILAMSMLNSDLYTCSADGWVKVTFFFFI